MGKSCGIYKITSPCKKVYIGQSKDIRKRWAGYKRLNCKNQPRLLNSFLKYGVGEHVFEIIHEVDSSELNYFERYYQELHDCIGEFGLNCCYQEADEMPRVVSEEVRNKISKARTGTKASEKAKEAMRAASKNRILSPELRKKFATQIGRELSNRQKKAIDWTGKKHTEETKEKIRKYRIQNPIDRNYMEKAWKKNKGKKRTLLTRDKISASLQGRTLSLSHKENLSESRKSIILNTENGIFYKGISDVSFVTGMSKDQVTNRMSGRCRSKISYIYV